MAQILHVSPATISFDLQHLRDESRENVRDYTTKQFPLQFKVSLVAIQNAMRRFWNISHNAQDNKEKMQALEHYRQCHIDRYDGYVKGWRICARSTHSRRK